MSSGIINKERSNGSRSASPIKQRKPIKQGVDLGIDLLVNKKFSPPTSPSHPKPRSLRLSASSSEASFDDRFSRLVNKNKKPNDFRREDSLKSGLRRERDRSEESTRMAPSSRQLDRHSERSRSERDKHSERSRSERDRHSERSRHSDRDRDKHSERSHSERDKGRSERNKGRSERSHGSDRDKGRSEKSGFFSRFGFGGNSSNGIKKFGGSEGKGDMPSFHGSDFDDSDLDKDINDIVIEESSNGDRGDRREREERGGWKDADSDDSDRRDLLDSEFERDKGRREREDDDGLPDEEKLSPAELLKLKRKKLLHIKVMTMQGYEPFRAVGLMNSLEEINEVEEEQMARRGLANSIEFMKKFLVGFSFLVEMGNNKYDPFNVDLKGWSEQIFEEKDEYNEVLEELYYKYGEHVAMMPEVKLLLMLGMSALMFHFSKKVMDNGMEVPGFEQIMKNNPELKRQYMNAAEQEMQKQGGAESLGGGAGGDGLGGFMNGLLGTMTGNQQTGNMLHQFMNLGGQKGPGAAASAQQMANGAGRRQRPSHPAKNEVDILSPVDPDNILENSFESASMSTRPVQQRKTRQGRNNINGLV